MKKNWKTIAIVTALVVTGLFIASFFFPAANQICAANDYTRAIECTQYHFGPYIVLWLINVVDNYSALVAAIAATVIAVLTVTIVKINKQQIEHARKVARAYISGGGPIKPDKSGKPIFRVSVNNYGQTPGILTKYAIGFCSCSHIPPVPKYEVECPYYDRIRPVPEFNKIIGGVNFPTNIPDPLIFGRFWYEDIWGDKHSSGFILVVDEGGRSVGNNVPQVPAAYTDWD